MFGIVTWSSSQPRSDCSISLGCDCSISLGCDSPNVRVALSGPLVCTATSVHCCSCGPGIYSAPANSLYWAQVTADWHRYSIAVWNHSTQTHLTLLILNFSLESFYTDTFNINFQFGIIPYSHSTPKIFSLKWHIEHHSLRKCTFIKIRMFLNTNLKKQKTISLLRPPVLIP